MLDALSKVAARLPAELASDRSFIREARVAVARPASDSPPPLPRTPPAFGAAPVAGSSGAAADEKTSLGLDFKGGKLTSITIEKEIVEKREPGEEVKNLFGLELGGSAAIDFSMITASVAVPLYFGSVPFPTGEGEAKGLRVRPAISFMHYEFDILGSTIKSDMMFWEITVGYFKAKFEEKEGKILGKGWFAGVGVAGYKADTEGFGLEGIQFPQIAAGADIFKFNPGEEKYTKITITVGFATNLTLGGTYTMFF